MLPFSVRTPQRRGRRYGLILIVMVCLAAAAAALVSAFLPAKTPQILLELQQRSPETAAFVAGYTGTQDKRPAIDLSSEVTAGEMPLFLQWDPRWGYGLYGGSRPEDMIGLSGCGPTALSMVAVHLTGDLSLNPWVVADHSAAKGHCTRSDGTSWTLMSQGSRDFGLSVQELPLDKQIMTAALEEGRPIILSLGAGDFTETGHYIVLCGADESGFEIRDPNSRANTAVPWTYEQLEGQIRNIWAFSVP